MDIQSQLVPIPTDIFKSEKNVIFPGITLALTLTIARPSKNINKGVMLQSLLPKYV